MTTIERLWEGLELPLADALHFADGHSYAVALDPTAPSGFSVLSRLDLDEMREEDPSSVSSVSSVSLVSSVDGRAVVDLGEEGLLWGGEGSYGSEGFLARLTAGRKLIWAMFFTESNPFERIRLSGSVATFRSTSGVAITVDIDDPRTPPHP
ncbi:hypothetical protein AB0A60_14950 [Streptomyces sp. NPDC046275]|uniref:hypothetical protein n=1 Tax=Streptomyces sp. NPDC046275 TaxID=3157201 RepID=UPI0033C8F951